MNARDLCNVHKYVDEVPKLRLMSDVCRACRLGKAHKLPFRRKFPRAAAVGDVGHSDIIGPLVPSFPDRYRYATSFQDEHSRYAYMGFMRRKSKLPASYKMFVKIISSVASAVVGTLSVHPNKMERFSKISFKRIHSDQAQEYKSLKNDLGRAVMKSYSPPYTPELLWPYAVKHAILIRNRIPHSATGVSPYFLMRGERPSPKHARVFGCTAYVLKLPEEAKFDTRAFERVSLEVLDHGVYKVLVKDEVGSPMIVESRHVTFDEGKFLGAPELTHCMDDEVSDDSTWEAYSSSDENTGVTFETDDEPDDVPVLSEEDDDGADDADGDPDDVPVLSVEEENIVDDGANGADDVDDDDNDAVADEDPDDSPALQHRYPRRSRKPLSAWFMAAAAKDISITTSDEPTLGEALQATAKEHEAWTSAIHEEFSSLETKEMWQLDSTPGVKPLPTHIVLKVKRDGQGEVDRFRARIVAGGNHQRYGEDYMETYAPVVQFSLVRFFLCLALCVGMFVTQVDIETAFLNGELEEDVWVRSSRGVPGIASRLYKLQKALYRLKQAHLAWHRKLCQGLTSMGFMELPSAPCVFKRKCGTLHAFILVYVDDLIIMAPTQEELDGIVKDLASLYEMRQSNNVELFLGVNIKWERPASTMPVSLLMSQKVYTMSVLRRFGMQDSKPALTPMVEGGMNLEEDKSVCSIELYQQMIGFLMYLALRTRPDILVAVLILARFQKGPTAYCHCRAKRVLRYLKGRGDHGVLFITGSMDLAVFVDADYAEDETDRKSMSGFITKLLELLSPPMKCLRWPTVADSRRSRASTLGRNFFYLSEAEPPPF